VSGDVLRVRVDPADSDPHPSHPKHHLTERQSEMADEPATPPVVEPPGEWEPRTREDYVNVYADALGLHETRREEAARKAKEEAGGDDDDSGDDRPPRRGRNLLGGPRK